MNIYQADEEIWSLKYMKSDKWKMKNEGKKKK